MLHVGLSLIEQALQVAVALLVVFLCVIECQDHDVRVAKWEEVFGIQRVA